METQPVSIDSVVNPSGDVTPTSPTSPQVGPMEGGIPIENPSRMKGRRRLFMGLKRISSSSSLGRPRSGSSPGYRSGGKASISCISLSSAGSPYDCSYGSSYSSELSAGYSTAPTSGPSTPGPEAQLEHRARVRVLGLEAPTSVALPSELRPSSPLCLTTTNISEVEEDYFSKPHHATNRKAKKAAPRPNFNFWNDLPAEIRMSVLRYLTPKEIVRCSHVSKSWNAMCFDGQLWSFLDTSDFYRDIPATALVNIINSAGPFVRDLNLRGCVQLKEQWGTNNFADACRNLENFSLEGTEIPRMAIHTFLLQNSGLIHVNLSGLPGATNNAMKIIAQYCPKVEYLNISWCKNIDTRGVLKVVEGCSKLRDLRAGEVLGWENTTLAEELFNRNTLERLVLMHSDISDEALTTLVTGSEPDIDFLTGRPSVPPRKLKHLDLTRCRNLTDTGLKALAYNVPEMEGLQLSKLTGITDAPLLELLPTMPKLTHLDLEELEDLTNEPITCLANSSCAPWLKHLSISYCENIGDAGMLPLVKNAVRLESLDMDNTRVSDLVLVECAANLRDRNRVARGITAGSRERPSVGMRVVAYDCANVTWTSIREVLSRNAEHTPKGTYPAQILALKCFYNYQPTVDEHTKRVMRGDFSAALRLERKWAEWMMLSEEAGAGGAGGRRRRRRAREAMMMHADEEDGGGFGGVGTQGRRRRARSGGSGCVIM
ncbi:F-box/LRR repeat-containing protein 2 [Rhizodiscina lignyota]|uniref:F-box/LRR repeat-containing protein 2 n=1 Tax=Rhizodiscina lignyota TaxID=1504668 RepID=A0A9P4IJY0_9PEZI|nr:F-box/LRR repeat-containing protein 2 [Rhizodiscina lignyota]